MYNRSNSQKKFMQNNLYQTSKTNYNLTNEEIKQTSFETNLLHGVDSNLNLLLSNLKKNNQNDRIYYPLHSKMKSPMKIKSTNNFSELNLVDAYNNLIEKNTQQNSGYLSQNESLYKNNMSENSNSLTYKKGNLTNISDYSKNRIKNNNSNMKGNRSFYSQQSNINKNYMLKRDKSSDRKNKLIRKKNTLI